jgi:hypothetical protein
MAKRVRGSTSRPGQRRPIQRSAARSTAPAAPATPSAATQNAAAAPTATPPPTLTHEEEARAAQLEAAIVAEERRAEDAARTARSPRRETAPRPTSSIAISAAEEYAYVARDVKRIVLVGGSLVLFLLGLWVLAHVTGFGPF